MAASAINHRNYLEQLKKSIVRESTPFSKLQDSAFDFACEGNDIEFVKWIIEHYSMGKGDVTKFNGLLHKIICCNGVKLAQYIVDEFNVETADVINFGAAIAATMSCRDILEAVQWFYDRFEVDYHEGVLCYAGQMGRADIVEWVLNKFGKSHRNVLHLEAYNSFGYGARNDIECIKLVTEYFQLHTDMIKRRALKYLCKGGNPLEDIQWFIETYNITSEEICSGRIKSFQYCTFETLQWFVEQYNMSPDDIRRDDNLTLRRACKRNNLELAQWLVDRFELTPADAGEYADLLVFGRVLSIGPKDAAKLS